MGFVLLGLAAGTGAGRGRRRVADVLARRHRRVALRNRRHDLPTRAHA
jgi:hypothetical protein